MYSISFFKNTGRDSGGGAARVSAVFVLFLLINTVLSAQSSTVDAGLRFESRKGEKFPVVSQVWKFSSAEDEGVRAGEILWMLDGASVEGLKPSDVLSRLGGKEGDKHTLQVGKDKREVRVKLRRLAGKCASGNCKTGRGVWDEPDARYEGDFVKGKFEGKGVMSYMSGNRHEGAYRAGKREGQGKFFFSTGTVYEGNFSNNNFNGKGALKYKTGETFEGDFVDDERTGEGVATWPNGDRYEGLWAADLRNGQGLMTYADGSKYDGNWKDGKRDGFGRMTSFEGWQYEGYWSNDLRHGFGKLRQKDGRRIEGNFQNDELPIDARESSGSAEPTAKIPQAAPANEGHDSGPMTASTGEAPSLVAQSPAISEFLKNGARNQPPKVVSAPKTAPAEADFSPKSADYLRPGGLKNLPTAANRKMPAAAPRGDKGLRLRQVKVLDGFFDNAAAADTWLVDNSRIADPKERADNLRGLSTMAATWAASAKNNLENFSKDLELPAREKAAELCDDFLATNAQLADKYMRLANLMANDVQHGDGSGKSPEILKARREVAELWPLHEQQYGSARNLFF